MFVEDYGWAVKMIFGGKHKIVPLSSFLHEASIYYKPILAMPKFNYSAMNVRFQVLYQNMLIARFYNFGKDFKMAPHHNSNINNSDGLKVFFDNPSFYELAAERILEDVVEPYLIWEEKMKSIQTRLSMLGKKKEDV